MSRITRFRAALLGAALTLALGAPLTTHAQQGGPPTNRIYANDELFTGVNAPRDLPNQGKFDTIYVLGSGLASVADAGPGDPDFNGGRWEATTFERIRRPLLMTAAAVSSQEVSIASRFT